MVGGKSVAVRGRPRSQYSGNRRLRYVRQPEIEIKTDPPDPRRLETIQPSNHQSTTKMSNTTNSKFIDQLMLNVMELDGFIRIEYEEMYPELFSSLKTHRPLPPTEEQNEEKGEAYWTYPLRLKYYEEKCYAAFEKWNRKCLEGLSNTELNHIVWITDKMVNYSLKLMDEESGACFDACAFFFDQDKNLVLTNPR